MRKKTKTIIAIFVVLFLIIALFFGIIIYIKANLKPSREFLRGELCSNGQTYCPVTSFVVDEGAYGKSTLVKLQEEGIIKDSNIVYYWNRIFGGHTFCAGYFEIPHQVEDANGVRDITLDELLSFIAEPSNAHQDTVWISLDEGDFISGFAEEIASKITLKENPTDDVLSKKNTLINYWNNEDVVRSYMSDYPFLTEEMFNEDVKNLLEGYLFPDTYEMFEYSSCDYITRKLLDRTLEIYEKYEDAFLNSKLSIHEIFTLASMVQWESGTVVDSEMIAGVFINRMENGASQDIYNLGSTVTACYAFDLTKEECYNVGDTTAYTERYHPYNTYTIDGLPPGPVCNPSEISIYAATHPDDNDYFYFSADMCNGGTVFAHSLYEHNRNIERYYLACSD